MAMAAASNHAMDCKTFLIGTLPDASSTTLRIMPATTGVRRAQRGQRARRQPAFCFDSRKVHT
jgi:hypothetical protein